MKYWWICLFLAGCCDDWDGEAVAKAWVAHHGLKNATVTCWRRNGLACWEECSVSYDTEGQLGRAVISIRCDKEYRDRYCRKAKDL